MMSLSLLLGRTQLFTAAKAPQLLIGGGTISTLVGTGLAVKAALSYKEKVSEPIITEYFDEVTKSQECFEGEELEKALAHDKKVCRNRLIIETAKTFAPSISFILAGVGMIGWGAGLAHAREVALSSALAASEETVKKLRADRENTVEPENFEYEVDGVKYTGKAVVTPAAYARIFDWENPNWSDNEIVTENLLQSMENYCNDRLRSRGHLFLNEVYDMLGFDRTMAGSVVGWYWTGLGDHGGDEYVDFRIRKIPVEAPSGEVKYVYTLDFNVDGPIYERLGS